MDSLITVIVPIYKVESFIERCIRSLMEQNYANIEFILVDDASPDSSILKAMHVVEQYPNRRDSVRVVFHAQNKGLPAARNTGLEFARGTYIFHCDSDDWIEREMLADMVKVAHSQKADIVYSDFYLSFDKRERHMKQPSYQRASECIIAMLNGRMKFNVWNKLVRRDLFERNRIWFPQGKSMGEDMTMIRLFCHAGIVAHLPRPYYHYRQTNAGAFTKSFSPKYIEDMVHNVNTTITYLRECYGERLEKELSFFKLNMKLPFLISTDRAMYDIWQSLFREANVFIDKNPAFSARIKFIQKAALKKQYGIVKIYNLLIVQFIYGIIYK